MALKLETTWIKQAMGGIVLCSACLSCIHKDWELVKEQDVRRILPRYAMLAAAVESRGEPDSIRKAAYRQFFAEEGYSLQDWDSSMLWYAKNNIPLYYDFYRLAGSNLSKESDILQKKVDSITAADTYRKDRLGYMLDSINLLSIPRSIYYSGELVNQEFNIQPHSAYTSGMGRLSLSILGLPHLEHSNAWDLELRFYAQDSTIQVERKKLDGSGHYELNLVVDKDKFVVRVAGHIRGLVPKLRMKEFVYLDSLRFIRDSSVSSSATAITEIANNTRGEAESEEFSNF